MIFGNKTFRQSFDNVNQCLYHVLQYNNLRIHGHYFVDYQIKIIEIFIEISATYAYCALWFSKQHGLYGQFIKPAGLCVSYNVSM